MSQRIARTPLSKDVATINLLHWSLRLMFLQARNPTTKDLTSLIRQNVNSPLIAHAHTYVYKAELVAGSVLEIVRTPLLPNDVLTVNIISCRWP